MNNLRNFLQNLLDNHIERELPKVRKEVQNHLKITEHELAQVGPERSTVDQIRLFLTYASMEFHNLAKAAVDGSYGGRDGAFFGAGKKMDNRLRAKIHLANEGFAAYMRKNAAKRCVAVETDTSSDPDSSESSNGTEASEEDEEKPSGQLRVTKEQMMEWVKEVSIFLQSCCVG